MFDSIRTIPVRVRPPYDVRIGSGLLGRCGDYLAALLGQRRIAVLADDTVASLYLDTVTAALEDAGFAVCSHIFPSGEGRKNLSTLTELLEFLASEHLTRTDCVAALGGGVTGDLAGFIAGTLLRGVALAQLPTSLLAQVDSSVGGKTGLDLPEGKNLIGCFYQPRLVLADTACLATLPRRQLSSGMAEVIKCGVIGDEAILHHLETAEEPNLPWLVARCCRYKAAVVSRDERDGGGRRVLNFGHTFGHAYEAAGGYDTRTHGEAVAAGMMHMLRWQVRHGLGGGQLLERLTPLLRRWDLPTRLPWDGAADYLARDKKRGGDGITVAVAERAGQGRLLTVPLAALMEDV